jgi:hypothetical protein
VPTSVDVAGGKIRFSKAAPPRSVQPPVMQSDRGEGVAGPSTPRPESSSQRRPGSVDGSERNQANRSPFDDENAANSASEYSASIQDKRRQSSMLDIPDAKNVNDDGISEMSISSGGSDRKSHLNQRASDEISVVSSLEENEHVGSIHLGGAGRGSSIAVLPQIKGD